MSVDKSKAATLADHPCFVCGSAVAPFGFNGRWTCRAHRAEGETMMAVTVDGGTVGTRYRSEKPAQPARGGDQAQGGLF